MKTSNLASILSAIGTIIAIAIDVAVPLNAGGCGTSKSDSPAGAAGAGSGSAGNSGSSGGVGAAAGTGAPMGTTGTSASSGSGGAGFSAGGSGAGGTDASAEGSASDAGSSGISADAGPEESGTNGAADGGAGTLSFFVTSEKSMTGNLGGLAGADAKCQRLATAVGAGGRAWAAYLSVDKGPAGTPINAKDRIGNGPWYNAKGALVAKDIADLHTRMGDHTAGNYMVLIDEHGSPIPGHWNPAGPVEHDILTGSKADGTLLSGVTCSDWTSASPTVKGQVGHSDGLGPNMATTGTYTFWNSAHANQSCMDTAPLGGAGRIYCFATN
jgi:hypothetical protein